MYLKRAQIENYRNLSNICFCPGKEINVIYGDNVQGKTNLTEAIWILTGQKSFRGNKDSQLINKDNQNRKAYIEADFYSGKREQNIKLSILNGRKVLLNDIPQKSASAFSGVFSAVVFSPAEMQLINDGPSIRRKFLDNAISMLRPKYASILNNYTRAVQQRNAVLKDIQFHSELSSMLDLFEDNIAKNGAYIISQRKMYMEAIMKYLPQIYSGISSNRENLEIVYKESGGGQFDEITAEKLRDMLYNVRKNDVITGTTSVGPHRDDIEFFINNDEVKIYGSQGQRRSAVLSLKLSEAEILKKHCGEQPITLLDDVMSELDRSRQDYILNHIKGWQVFITCCDPTTIENLDTGKCFKIKSGNIVEQQEM